MTAALIGHTGFVGSNLLQQRPFEFLFNSKNIAEIENLNCDLVVCAGAPAAKWIANKNPELDRRNIEQLISHIKTVRTKLFVLISTVDVFAVPCLVNEDSPVDSACLLPYGKNRFSLEEFVASNFTHLIVRLPALFGKNLKKNIIYDFLNKNRLDLIHQEGTFQFYNLNKVWSDIERATSAKVSLIHFATEPLSVKEVARQIFGIDFQGNHPPPAPKYDFRSKFDYLWDGKNGYLYSKERILEDLFAFVEQSNRSKPLQ